jgi:hypothetical protein
LLLGWPQRDGRSRPTPTLRRKFALIPPERHSRCHVDHYHRQQLCPRRAGGCEIVALPPDPIGERAIMADEFAHLAQTDQNIAAAKEHIGKQRQLIERLAANGHSVRDAESFLFALTGMLSAFEYHRHLILQRLQP